MKKLLFVLIFVWSSLAFAQTPPAGTTGAALRSWIKTNFYDGQLTSLGYSQARVYMYNYIDNYNNSITCVYGGYVMPWAYGGTSSNPMPINCEHTIPQSFFSEAEPMRSDLHHLFPTYSNWNSRRSNYPFREIADSSTQYWMINQTETTSIPTSNINGYSEGTASTFEPRESHKGNVARAVFYFFTMYPSYSITMVAEPSLLWQWHLQDPVDAAELERNNRIQQYQGNRNPYIDHPEWLGTAWGFEGGTTPTNVAPTANFSFSANYLAVSFTDSSTDSDGTVTGWSWNFGNGATSTSKNPSHTYAAAGTYTVTLTATDNQGATHSTSKQVTVTDAPAPTTPALANGVSTNFTVALDAVTRYVINVPANAVNLVVTMTGTGAADLYVKRAAINWPADKGLHNEAEFKAPYINGTAESVTFPTPAQDQWNVLIHGFKASSGTITATWQIASTGQWTYVPFAAETPHNYANSKTYTATYEKVGATQVGIHFATLTTESGYDWLSIKDSTGKVIYRVSGSLVSSGAGSVFGRTDGWAIINGSKITVELVTDSSVTKYGYKIDNAAYFQ